MDARPTGTVTFLFSDIEGSTQHWENFPDAMQRAFTRQEEIIREAVARHNGYAYKMIGDAFQIAFATAFDALAAALDAQRALHAEIWGEVGGIKVRMALQTGVTEERGDDYVGPLLNRAARLLSVGYGGQILVSDATQSLVRAELPSNVTLRDLGERRLKDLTRVEHIYQVVSPDLPSDFSPLKTLDTLPNNLPLQLTSFIGREKEIEEIKRLLTTTRLLALTGAGGCGKTRLALRVAEDLLDEFADGVWFVDLAPLSDPSLVPQVVATALALRNESARPMLEALKDYLKEKYLLIALDNCEHLIEACAQIADALLHACPNLKILATSREALNIAGETTFRVPSLSLPDPQPLPPPEKLAQFEALRLFGERASAVQSHFQLTHTNAPAIAQICQRLDGIPLAIELAAARVKSLSVGELAAHLDDRFQLLTSGSRTAVPRQQTLRATIDWSYELLSEQERILLRRLSVFAGGWILEAAEAVCSNGIDAQAILDLQSQLIDKSLVVAEEREGETRYRLLETIRQYALDRLGESGEAHEVRDRHLDYFLQWAEKAEAHLIRPEQFAWLNRFEAEHDNIRAALEWSQVTVKGANAGLRLTAVMGDFWKLHGYNTEGRMRLSAALAQKGAQQPTIARAQALYQASVFAFYQSDYSAVRALAEQSLAISRELGAAGRLAVASALEMLAEAATETGDYSTAPQLYGQALSVYKEVGDLVGIGDTLKMLGWGAMRTGDYEQAESRLEESLVVCRQSGDLRQISAALAGLGELAVRRGQYERAGDLLRESLDISRRSGEKWRLAIALGSLGWIALRQHDYKAMSNLLAESLAVRTQTGDKAGIAWCLEKLAEAASLQGQPEKAVKTFGAAAALRAPVGSVIDPVDRPEYERILSGLRTVLGEDAFAAAWAEGQAMALEQAIAEAEQVTVADQPVQLAPAYPAGLTEREVEVLRWLARGLSNQEIADKLVLSRRTVHAHLRSIYSKLDVTTRSAATRAAIDQKIVNS